MSDLRSVISRLASQFANGVLEAIRGASLEDILVETRTEGGSPRASSARAPSARAASTGAATPAPKVESSRKRGHLERRSPGDITDVIGRIVTLLGENPKGLRAEQIKSKLGLDARELPRPIAQALADKKITKAGEKRATTYFAGGARSAPATAKPLAARTATTNAEAPAAAKKPGGDAPKKPKKKLKPIVRAGSAPAAAPKSEPESEKRAPKSGKGATKASAKVGPSGETKGDAKAGKAKKGGERGKSEKGSKSAPKASISSIEEAVTIVTNGAPGDSSG